MYILGYCLREAVTSLWRQRGSTWLSLLTTATALFVLGVFLTATINVGRVTRSWGTAAELSVYLEDDISEEQRGALNRLLHGSPVVRSSSYVPKAVALERFARDFPDLATAARALDENPLPASIDVQLVPDAASGTDAAALATALASQPGVADVRYDRAWLDRLSSIVRGAAWAGWGLGFLLTLGAVLTTSTVVRLSLHERRHEVDILRLMGAPLLSLRGPLVVEGILHGALGAVAGLVALYAVHAIVRLQAGAVWLSTSSTGTIEYLGWPWAVAVAAGGILVGAAGGLLAARHAA